ncbi:MAG: hypothetical protein ACI91R_001972 [Vicingaceae bacterium]
MNSQRQLRKGHYYDLDGNKTEGNFKIKCNFSEAGSKLTFYTNSNEKLKLNTSNVLSIIIGYNSLSVIRNFSAGGLSYYEAAFALVYYTGAINIYKHERKLLQFNRYLSSSYPIIEI